MQPVVMTLIWGSVNRSHRVAATGLASVNAPGGEVEAVVEYATRGVVPDELPQSNAAVEASGTKYVPMGTASVMTKVNADPVEKLLQHSRNVTVSPEGATVSRGRFVMLTLTPSTRTAARPVIDPSAVSAPTSVCI